MFKKINEEFKIKAVSSFIDDLNSEKKPKIYKDITDDKILDTERSEMEKLFETIRAVKRLRTTETINKKSNEENQIVKVKHEFGVNGTKFRGIISKLVASVAIIVVIFFALDSHFLKESDIWEGQNYSISSSNVVYAVEEAFNNLESYIGVIEIFSVNGEKIDFHEEIQIKYKKPNKFYAIHSYNGFTKTQVSDGDKLTIITPDEVTVDYSSPRKELWRYNILDQIQEFKLAKEINEIGEESFQGRDTIVFEFRFSQEELFNKIWIDKETKMPLKTELNHPGNRKLVNQFAQLDVNIKIDDTEFVYQPEAGAKVVELNSISNLEEISRYWSYTDDLIKQISDNFKVQKVVRLDEDILHDYLVKFKGYNESDFLDIYISLKPVSEYYSNTWELGKLQDGWTMVERDAVNLFKVYIGEYNYAQWSTSSWEIRMVSNRNTEQLKEILEATAGEEISPITNEDLKSLGVKLMDAKPGH